MKSVKLDDADATSDDEDEDEDGDDRPKRRKKGKSRRRADDADDKPPPPSDEPAKAGGDSHFSEDLVRMSVMTANLALLSVCAITVGAALKSVTKRV